MDKSLHKDYFSMSSSDKKKIIRKAAQESTKDQVELVRRVRSKMNRCGA